MTLRAFLTLFCHWWPLSTKQLIQSSNKNLRIPQIRRQKNVTLPPTIFFTIPATRNLKNQTQQVTVNQVATKKTRQKKNIMFDVSNFKS